MIFFDMDGTLAKFYYDKQCLEHMYEERYFLTLKPYKLVDYVRKLVTNTNADVGILSACIESKYCEREKLAWLEKYLPELVGQHRILFTHVGENKAQVAKRWAEKVAPDTKQIILIDDYSQNIYDFERAGMVGIKFLNGINNKTDKTYQYKVRTTKQLHKLLTDLNEINIAYTSVVS
jgi:5'(3')-deoxyribonucleotidase